MSQPAATHANVAALIPCYYEEKHIRDVATRAHAQLDTVLVVDDGSTDKTSDEARAAGVDVVKHEKNAGKGAAIKTGLRTLLARENIEFILILDGDGQHLPGEIPHFLTAANATAAPMIVGNRMGDTRDMPFVRRMTNRYMSWTISRVIGQRVPDSQCGFRMFHRSLAAELLAMQSSSFDLGISQNWYFVDPFPVVLVSQQPFEKRITWTFRHIWKSLLFILAKYRI